MARLDDDRRNNPFAAPGSDFVQDLADPDLYPEGHNGPVVYGTFGQRLIALIVDSIIFFFVVMIFSLIFGMAIGAYFANLEYEPDEIIYEIFGNFIGILVAWLYYALLESSAIQATFGKKLLGLKVTDLQGNRISFLRATGRHFGKIVSGLVFSLGYLVQPFTPRKQAWHDSLAGTLVVKA